MSDVSIDFIKFLDANVIRMEIGNSIDNLRNQQYMWNLVEPILKKNEHKKVTKRLITEIKKTLPELKNAYLRDVITSKYLELRYKDTELSIHLGNIIPKEYNRGADGTYTMNGIKESNAWLYTFDEYIKSKFKGLSHIDMNVMKWNNHLKSLQKIYADVKGFSGLEYKFKIKD